jgi:F-box domain
MSPGFIDKLPPEGNYQEIIFPPNFLIFVLAVLLVVFNYLDDLSMCAASRVCLRWKRLLEARVTNDQWRLYTKNRWPLFNPLFDIDDWHLAFKKL